MTAGPGQRLVSERAVGERAVGERAVGELHAALPADVVLTDPASTDAYRRDHAGFGPAGVPLCVVRPTSTEQVQEVLRWATRHRVPVVPQGARSGLSGGANAVDGCVVVSMTRMDRILEIDPVDQVAVVEPGVVNAVLSRAVLEQGLFYPPDPSSWEISTIGGNIATNAGGLCCVKYGVTTDYVRGLDVVLADGRLLRTGRRTAKGVAGLDLTRLVVGSEGTLGVVTRATLSLRPAPPPALTVAAVFGAVPAALAAANRIMSSGLSPSLLEYLDATTVEAVQALRDMGLPPDASAMLIAQSDRAGLAEQDVAEMGRICADEGAVDVAVASDAEESALLLTARRMAITALEQIGTLLVDDVAVPRARLADLLAGLERIAGERDVRIACPAHVGDGNTHPTVVFDPTDPAAAERAQLAFADVMRLGLSLGGTITGEHGVGQLKRSLLRTELGEVSHDLQRSIKDLFDPLGILNPGKAL